MYSNRKQLYLMSTFLLSVLILFVCQNYFVKSVQQTSYNEMRKASELTAKWFEIVEDLKKAKGILPLSESNIKYKYLLGDDYTPMTTTLGSLEAKEAAANPDFSALIIKMIIENGFDSNSVIGMTISGSFPSLSIATLAAIQTLGLNVILISSLGSSTYGANQSEVTWIDIEKELMRVGSLKYSSNLVTLGAENDRGEGILEEGVEIMHQAAERNNVQLYVAESFEESLLKKYELFLDNKINLYLNIGGNQTSLGNCIHASTIENGFHRNYLGCNDIGRGLLIRLSENNIPFIHLLNIKDLALKFGLPMTVGSMMIGTSDIYYHKEVLKLPLALSISFIIFLLLLYKLLIKKSIL